MRVLVVDPDPESRDALRRAFAAAGDQVRGVASVAEGDRHLVEFAPDAVVAALDVPDGDATQFLDRARASDPRRGVYALVAADRLEDGVDAMSRGAHDFLWRPISEGPGRRAALAIRRPARTGRMARADAAAPGQGGDRDEPARPA